MIGFLAALFASGGIVRATKTPKGKARYSWTTAHQSWMHATPHSDERVQRAKDKRVRRAAVVRRAVAAGGYGPRPYAGVKGGSPHPVVKAAQ